MVGGPGFDDLQRVGVQLAEHYVSCILIGGIDCPQAALVHHKVNVRMAPPGVVIRIVEACVVQLPGLDDGGGAEVKLDDDMALEFVEKDGAIVDHLTRPGPWVWQPVGREVVRRHEVMHRLIFSHKTVVMVTVHVPHLNITTRVRESVETENTIQELHKKKKM